MINLTSMRIIAVCAGLMGAAGVALAASAAHLPDATRMASASSMLLFHALAAIGAALLAERNVTRSGAGLVAAFGFIIGATLFAGELSLRQFADTSLFAMAAPTGGSLLIVAWLSLSVAALWPRRA